MKTRILIAAIFLGVIGLQAQTLPQGWSGGFQLNQYHGDFGMGLHVNSGRFLYNTLSIKLRGNIQFLSHPENGEETWTPYTHLSLGIASWGREISSGVRAYGEGGVLLILPAEKVSNEGPQLGGYGLFGVEVFVGPPATFFFEMGAGSGAVANLLPGKPIYANGFILSTGFRYFFTK